MKSLLALCAGVMTLCATSSLFVSCDKYDDSALVERVDELEGRLEAIEALKSQLETLTSRVDALYTLKFQVNDSNELQYSFDNGTTWTSTGIILAEECDAPCTCPEVSLVDNGDSVTITVGDQSFTIEKPEEIVFEIKAGKLYFASEATQVISIKSEGVDDITVMAAPKGWYAEINAEGNIEVTAPNVADIQDGYGYDDEGNYFETPAKAAATGYVKVHACSAEGKCMVGKLSVEVSENQVIVKAYAGTYEVTAVDSYGWAKAYFGIAERSEWEAQATELIEALETSNYEILDAWTNLAAPSATGKIADVLGKDPEVGKEYVVWALSDMVYEPTLEDVVLAYYSPIAVTVTEDAAKKTPYDLYVSIEVAGADSYYAAAIPSSQFTWSDLDYYVNSMAEEMAYGGPSFARLHTENYEGSYRLVGKESVNPNPGETVYLLVLPVDGRPTDAYTVEDVKKFEYATSKLTGGGAVAATAVLNTEGVDPYTQLSVNINADSDDWNYVYFEWVDETTYASFTDDQSIVDYILSLETAWGLTPAEFANPVTEYDLTPGKKMHFVGFFVDKDYKYGAIAKAEGTTKELVQSEVTLDIADNLSRGVLLNTGTLEITPNPSEPVSKYRYVMTETNWYNLYQGKDGAAMANYISLADPSEVTEILASELVDGKIIIDGFAFSSSYYVAILPYDMAGNPSKWAEIIEFECSFALTEVITDAASFVSEPTIKFEIPANLTDLPEEERWNYNQGYYSEVYVDEFEGVTYITHHYDVAYTVEAEEGVEVLSFFAEDPSATMTDLEKASGLWAYEFGSYYTNSGSGSFNKSLYGSDTEYPAPAIYVSWTTGGKYYFKQVDLSAQFKQMYNDLMGIEQEPDPGQPETPAEPTVATVAEFLAAAVNSEVYYKLTGEIVSIANTEYGNLTIKDETGEVYIYGLTAEKYSEYVYNESRDSWSWTNDKSFSTLDLKVGDVLTLVGTRAVYRESPQVGGAYYVSHVDAVEPPVEEGPADLTNVIITPGEKYNKQEATINEVLTVVHKLGTSEENGTMTVTLPAGTKKVTYNAVGWRGKTTSLNITLAPFPAMPQTINANDGATGTPTYTITATDADTYVLDLEELDLELTTATDVTVESVGRAIIWNIVAE